MPINIDDKTLEFIYVIAVRDATQQKAFNVSDKKDLWENKTARASIVNLLKTHIDNIIAGKLRNQASYNNDFDLLAKAINGAIKKQFNYKNDFEFGNCQKLINMFVKYIYITTYMQSSLKDNFKYCHCPMDNIMLKDVWSKKKKFLKQSGYKRDGFLNSWSKETFVSRKRYDDFQKQVIDLCKNETILPSGRPSFPIEYDYIIW